MPSVAIKSFGCRVNQAEVFAWADELGREGWRVETACPERADVVIVNSCTLTARADRDVFKFVRKAGRENPRARIIVTGCLAERAAAELGRLPGVAFVAGNKEKDTLARKALELAGKDLSSAGETAVSDVSADEADPDKDAVRHGPEDDTAFRSRAVLKVQDGCGMRCTYCIIPAVRGPNHSIPIENIVSCVASLADRGFNEVVLAGIHLSSYGADLEPRVSLANLIEAVGKLDWPGWLRLTSLDPRLTGPELVSRVAADPKVAQHFHLSLQHASERVLRRMGRGGGPEHYSGLLRRFRELSPWAALGADVIVGFPGETEEDFRELRDFLAHSPLTYFHVFSYSPRRGTPAAGLEQVRDEVKAERSRMLRKLSAEKSLAFRRSLIGRDLRGIVIRRGVRPAGKHAGPAPTGGPGEGLTVPGAERGRLSEVLTENYVRVMAAGDCPPERSMVSVRLTGVRAGLNEGVISGALPGAERTGGRPGAAAGI
jgi:threonylcarbamoyladenosine tRNA methylthiotransferase MtaB